MSASTDTAETYTFAELCGALGKGSFYVRNLQKHLGLPLLHGRTGGKKATGGYSDRHLIFLENTTRLLVEGVALRVLEGRIGMTWRDFGEPEIRCPDAPSI